MQWGPEKREPAMTAPDVAAMVRETEELRMEVAALRACVAELAAGHGRVSDVFASCGWTQTPASLLGCQTVRELFKTLMGVIVTARTFIGPAPVGRNAGNAVSLLDGHIEVAIPTNLAAVYVQAVQDQRFPDDP